MHKFHIDRDKITKNAIDLINEITGNRVADFEYATVLNDGNNAWIDFRTVGGFATFIIGIDNYRLLKKELK
jgi:hypothetical protein